MPHYAMVLMALSDRRAAPAAIYDAAAGPS